jgi:hypothetical protein
VPYILALTPYCDVFVTIDSNLISTFVSLHPIVAHDVVMAKLLDVCLFVYLLSLVAFCCNKNPTDEQLYSEVRFTSYSRRFHVPQQSTTCLVEFSANKFLGLCKQNL